MLNIVSLLLVTNGIYDIVCSVCILYGNIPPFSTLHSNMFSRTLETSEKRIMAYWIATYGVVRLYSGITLEALPLSAATYLGEAFCFEYEHYNSQKMIVEKVRFVSISSIFLGFMIIGYLRTHESHE